MTVSEFDAHRTQELAPLSPGDQTHASLPFASADAQPSHSGLKSYSGLKSQSSSLNHPRSQSLSKLQHHSIAESHSIAKSHSSSQSYSRSLKHSSLKGLSKLSAADAASLMHSAPFFAMALQAQAPQPEEQSIPATVPSPVAPSAPLTNPATTATASSSPANAATASPTNTAQATPVAPATDRASRYSAKPNASSATSPSEYSENMAVAEMSHNIAQSDNSNNISLPGARSNAASCSAERTLSRQTPVAPVALVGMAMTHGSKYINSNSTNLNKHVDKRTKLQQGRHDSHSAFINITGLAKQVHLASDNLATGNLAAAYLDELQPLSALSTSSSPYMKSRGQAELYQDRGPYAHAAGNNSMVNDKAVSSSTTRGFAASGSAASGSAASGSTSNSSRSANDVSQMLEQRQSSMKAQFSSERYIQMPGFGFYSQEKQAIFMDHHSLELLALPREWARQWLPYRKILAFLTKEQRHQLIHEVQSLNDSFQCFSRTLQFSRNCPLGFNLEECAHGQCYCVKHNAGHVHLNADRTSFNIVIPRGDHAGTQVYIKLNGLFASGKLSHVSFTITRVASPMFELVPHLVTDSASFDWLIPTNECIYGRNYYNILGYRNNDPRVPFNENKWRHTVVHPDDLATMSNEYRLVKSPRYGNNYEMLYRSKCSDNSYIWTKFIGKIVARNPQGKATRVIGINIDINRVLEGYEQLQSKVFTDILTGLHNRTYLITQMDRFIYNIPSPLTIIFTDITALKIYNDYLGHTIGDKLLCTAAMLMKNTITLPKEIIRISGDEIICLLPSCNNSEAELIEHNIHMALNHYNRNAPIRMPVFFSMGHCTIDLSKYHGRKLSPDEKEEAYELIYGAINQADLAMQKNKRLEHQEHYALVKAYIENQLQQSITLTDKRLF